MPKGRNSNKPYKGRGKKPGKSYARENVNKDLSTGLVRTRGDNRNPDIPDRRKVTVHPRTASHRGMRERIVEEIDCYYDYFLRDTSSTQDSPVAKISVSLYEMSISSLLEKTEEKEEITEERSDTLKIEEDAASMPLKAKII